VYQVLVNQIAAIIGREVRVPMNIYKQSNEDIRWLTIEFLEVKPYVRNALL